MPPQKATAKSAKKTRKDDRAADREEDLLAALRRFIRVRGEDYLRDPNITSIGIGYKVTDGRRTPDLSVQFTVNEKHSAPDALEALGTAAVPRSITVDGVEVPTDVLERRYEPAFKVVPEPVAVQRKARIDPIVPGVSVGNVRVSAGTIGGIVYDRADGTPYVLSNWHVLHGPDGALGDDIVQPGTHDDNRTDRNRLGRLVRSHLGIAGDCAVADIEDREFDPATIELDVVPEQLGEPELGDTVVKSGRTTGVTHGIVRRVDTIVKIDYGGDVGVRNIGCFEIGPDPDHPAAAAQISRGGDSGSLWMFTRAGQTQTVVAGLHFGGESDTSPDDHALACLPASVFEKLAISLRPPTVHEVEETGGYDRDFLGVRIDVPVPAASLRDDVAVTVDGQEIVRYTHFSLQMRASRRFPFWVAWNVDGGSLKGLSRKGIKFVKDPRIPEDLQVGDELYSDNDLDRGHLARRADLLWGSLPVAKKANTDSFFFTNITPQMDDFNQSARAGVWGQLEDAVLADVDVEDLKISVFGGPVFQDDDRVYRGVRLPREYWKVLVFREDGELSARAFLLTQNLVQLEALELDEFRVFQTSVPELEERTGLRFSDVLRDADTLAVPEALERRTPLEGTDDIRW
ncbi:DNA/RNA non-specific endonuclease [Modestobacter marinus]|uniref:DNA/RNA non-specific endonuclease n=1 Tax=Modestobacter marinus TaxID=477641 RepID=UPI001C94B4D7|nr:DNA/RNA non-specific endonuclease [Modestobacter marinus]